MTDPISNNLLETLGTLIEALLSVTLGDDAEYLLILAKPIENKEKMELASISQLTLEQQKILIESVLEIMNE